MYGSFSVLEERKGLYERSAKACMRGAQRLRLSLAARNVSRNVLTIYRRIWFGFEFGVGVCALDTIFIVGMYGKNIYSRVESLL